MSSYASQRAGRATGKRTAGRGRSYERILELKSLVDRIINDCSIESKEVKSGLQMIKNYQLDVLDEIRDVPEEDEERTYYAPAGRDTYEPYSRNTQELREYADAPAYSDPRTVSQVANLREEKITLMNELNQEIRSGNRLAHDYKTLQSDYLKVKREYERLSKRGKYDESSNEGESIVNKAPQEAPRARVTDDYTRHRDHGAKLSYDEAPPARHRDSLENENARLREELAQAYETIRDLQDKLSRTEAELARWEREGASRRPAGRGDSDRLSEALRKAENKIASLEESLRQGGDLKSQLAALKHQNQELRVETIRLLKKKESGGGSGEVQQLHEEIMKLHETIESQNVAKREFIADMENYKKRYVQLENENRQLKAKVGQAGVEPRYNYVKPRVRQGAAAEFSSSYEQAEHDAGSKLDRYRSVLNSMKTYDNRYPL